MSDNQKRKLDPEDPSPIAQDPINDALLAGNYDDLDDLDTVRRVEAIFDDVHFLPRQEVQNTYFFKYGRVLRVPDIDTMIAYLVNRNTRLHLVSFDPSYTFLTLHTRPSLHLTHRNPPTVRQLCTRLQRLCPTLVVQHVLARMYHCVYGTLPPFPLTDTTGSASSWQHLITQSPLAGGDQWLAETLAPRIGADEDNPVQMAERVPIIIRVNTSHLSARVVHAGVISEVEERRQKNTKRKKKRKKKANVEEGKPVQHWPSGEGQFVEVQQERSNALENRDQAKYKVDVVLAANSLTSSSLSVPPPATTSYVVTHPPCNHIAVVSSPYVSSSKPYPSRAEECDELSDARTLRNFMRLFNDFRVVAAEWAAEHYRIKFGRRLWWEGCETDFEGVKLTEHLTILLPTALCIFKMKISQDDIIHYIRLTQPYPLKLTKRPLTFNVLRARLLRLCTPQPRLSPAQLTSTISNLYIKVYSSILSFHTLKIHILGRQDYIRAWRDLIKEVGLAKPDSYDQVVPLLGTPEDLVDPPSATVISREVVEWEQDRKRGWAARVRAPGCVDASGIGWESGENKGNRGWVSVAEGKRPVPVSVPVPTPAPETGLVLEQKMRAMLTEQQRKIVELLFCVNAVRPRPKRMLIDL